MTKTKVIFRRLILNIFILCSCLTCKYEYNLKAWESKALIRFPDCDPFNHLNNARHFNYFINAREDDINANMNFNIYHFAAQHGLGWVVSKNQIVYLKPAFLMETVVIDSTLSRLGETDLLVEMKMWNEGRDKLKSVL